MYRKIEREDGEREKREEKVHKITLDKLAQILKMKYLY